MKSIFMAILFILSIQLSAQEVEIVGTKYKVIKSETSLQCDNFSIRSETLKLPSHLHHSLIPKELNLGHSGGNYIGHKLFFSSQMISNEIVGIKQVLAGYHKLADDRVYIVNPVRCLSNNSVLISLYGGGNCDDVCEGYASLAFDLKGKIINSKGHSYQKFKELKNNKI